MANTLNIFNIDKHYLTATIPFLLDIQGFGIHNKAITKYYISWVIQHANLYRRINSLKYIFSSTMDSFHARPAPITDIETKKSIIKLQSYISVNMATPAKRMSRSRQEDKENEYPQLSYETDTGEEELSQPPGNSSEFLPTSTKNTKGLKLKTKEASQLPKEADVAPEELNEPPPNWCLPPRSPEYLPAVSPQLPDSSTKSATTEAPVAKKQIYLTREKLLTVKCDKLRRRLAPIQKWAYLTVGHPYLLKRIIGIPVHKRSKKPGASSTAPVFVEETGYYAELETETDSMINVWLTSIMLEESENFDLSSNDVYIIPLGKRISQEKQNEYHSFIIVRADELEYNIN